MPSFDVTSDVDWQEVDNAINQAVKEVLTRFDFKNVKTEIKLDKKAKTITLWSAQEGKMDSLKDLFESKLVKRGVSLLSLEYETLDQAFGGSVRQVVKIQAGISKEKAKEVIAAIKDSKAKVNAQIQDETVRVTGKNRDDLQGVIAILRAKQDTLKLPMQFGNFRE